MRKFKDFIESNNIYLRRLKINDVNQNYCNWMKDLEITQYLEARFEKRAIKKLKDYVRKNENNPDCILLAIISKNGNKHIGNVKIGPINRIHKFADMGIIIGEKSFRRKGFATEAIKLIVDYAFNRLKLHKITAGAYANNIGSIKAFKNAGFVIEGTRKKHYFYKDRYVDSVLFGILRK